MSRVCFLSGSSTCRSKLSREHYISRAVLERVFVGSTGVVQGLPWSDAVYQQVSLMSLTAKILCEGHNNELSDLDTVAGNFLDFVQRAQLHLAGRAEVPRPLTISGHLLERWLLRVAAGMLASGNLSHQGKRLEAEVPEQWKQCLLGKLFPEGWGLYIRPPTHEFAMAEREFEVVPLSGHDRLPRAFHFALARLPLTLVLGRPDVQSEWGFFRPEGIALTDNFWNHRVQLEWAPKPASGPIEYTRLRDA